MKKKLPLLFAMLAVMVTTAYADNVISASDLTISKSGSADLAINLTSNESDPAVRGIQFTLTLPAGVSVQGSDAGITYEDGGTQTYTPTNGVKVSTTERTSGWTVIGNKTGDNTYKFVLISLSGLKISKEGSDAIMKISFQAANGVTSGVYEVAITDIHLSVDGSSEDFTSADTTAKLTISDVQKGDVNGDGDVDAGDAVCILKYVVGKTNTTFIESVADVNGDGDIDAGDAVLILKFVVGKVSALSRGVANIDWDNLKDPD